ncbi:MAG: enoyl-CoA hydratase-related protein [Candidatus Krumholzibacteria bacterium]|nr:enoyl-CoA hydratase-related protein [Candidatus Krumholzibacteria bacterium]
MPIRQEVAGRVLVVTIDNPKVKNAFDKVTVAELRELFEALVFRDVLPPDPNEVKGPDGWDIGPDGRYRPHAVVLRASGDVFCAGAHLGEMKELGEANYQENMTAALDMGAMFRAVRNCSAPVVACVQGPAYGGGVGLVAACDIVVADLKARFAFSEVKLGLVPGVISPLVIDRIGQAAARTYFLTAETIGPRQALRLGLVDRLADKESLTETVEAVVNSLLRGGADALGLCKALLEGAESLGYARSGELTARMIAEARTNPEAQVALKAFFAKQPVPWQDDTPWTMPPVATGEDG